MRKGKKLCSRKKKEKKRKIKRYGRKENTYPTA